MSAASSHQPESARASPPPVARDKSARDRFRFRRERRARSSERRSRHVLCRLRLGGMLSKPRQRRRRRAFARIRWSRSLRASLSSTPLTTRGSSSSKKTCATLTYSLMATRAGTSAAIQRARPRRRAEWRARWNRRARAASRSRAARRSSDRFRAGGVRRHAKCRRRKRGRRRRQHFIATIAAKRCSMNSAITSLRSVPAMSI